MTGKIQALSYAVNTSNGVLVDAGFGDDQIVVNGSNNYPLNVTIRGMQGSDRLRVYGE